MNRAYPIELPFGIRLMACHGIPMTVMLLTVSLIGFLMLELSSRLISPVTLSAIWIVNPAGTPQFTTAQIANGAQAKLGKAGEWLRLCPSYAQETFMDDYGNQVAMSGRHQIDVPGVAGPIEHAPRPIRIPKLLDHAGRYKVRLDVYSVCYPWERIWPIPSTSQTTEFDVVPG